MAEQNTTGLGAAKCLTTYDEDEQEDVAVLRLVLESLADRGRKRLSRLPVPIIKCAGEDPHGVGRRHPARDDVDGTVVLHLQGDFVVAVSLGIFLWQPPIARVRFSVTCTPAVQPRVRIP